MAIEVSKTSFQDHDTVFLSPVSVLCSLANLLFFRRLLVEGDSVPKVVRGLGLVTMKVAVGISEVDIFFSPSECAESVDKVGGSRVAAIFSSPHRRSRRNLKFRSRLITCW